MEFNFNGHTRKSLTLNRVKVPNVILVGATASGKSTIGRYLACHLGFGLLDLDGAIEAKAGQPVHVIFAEQGEHRFREIEAEVIADLAQIRNHVIITGAGALESDESWQRLKKLGAMVWIATPIGEIVNRLVMSHEQLSRRPLLAEAVKIEDRAERAEYLNKKLSELLERRIERYSDADCIFEDRFSTPEASALIIKSMLLKLGTPQADQGRL